MPIGKLSNKAAQQDKAEKKANKKEEKVDVAGVVFPIKNLSDKDQKDAPPSLRIASYRPDINNNKTRVLVSVQPPESVKRIPVDIVCVVDISGSMSSRATTKDASGKEEGSPLTMLSLVSHAVRTVASALGEQDRLALVAFDDSGETRYNLDYMNDNNKKKLYKIADELQTRGGTNIWAGIKEGLDTLSNASKTDGRRLGSVVILTDGQPTSSPPEGEAGATRSYIESKKLPGNVSTFGFGYGINTNMLAGVAEAAGGTYCFIPDSTIVGTAFVNWTANFLSTAAQRCVLSLEALDGASFAEKQVAKIDKVTWGLRYEIPSVAYGQNQDVVIEMENVPEGSENFLRATLNYHNGWGNFDEETTKCKPSGEFYQLVKTQYARTVAVNALRDVVKVDGVHKAIAEIKSDTEAASFPQVSALLEDLEGQGLLSYKQDNQKWGPHFLVSLRMAHETQQCNNFKDPGVQHYGGDLFKAIRDDLDEIFVKLPPPTTTAYGYDNSTPVNMNQYYNCGGGCFHGNANVTMSNGSTRKVKELKKGDEVKTAEGSSKVVCILKTVMSQKKANLCDVNGLLLTPYHPVRVEGSWRFPTDLSETVAYDCDAVYTFLLAGGSTMFVEEMEAIALNHNIENDPVATHAYFGTSQVVDDLRKMRGFAEGLVTIVPTSFVRDHTGKVCGMVDDVIDTCHTTNVENIVRNVYRSNA